MKDMGERFTPPDERVSLIEALARDFRGSTEQSIDAKLDWIMTALLFILKEKR